MRTVCLVATFGLPALVSGYRVPPAPVSLKVSASNDLKAVADGRCSAACGVGVDSSCVPQCQVEMYWCLDHDPPYESDKRDSCMNEAEGKYKKFGAEWDATHPYLLLHARTGVQKFYISAKEQLAVADRCEVSCGKSVDSTCVPQCQVKMYWCLDHDPPLESDKRDTCMKDAEGEFKKFGANWDAVHPYLLLHRKETTELSATTQKTAVFGDLKAIADGRCTKACGVGVDSSCVPQCQVEMYWCLDHDPPYESDKRDTCMNEVEDKYVDFGSEWDATHPYLLLHNFNSSKQSFFSAKQMTTVGDRCIAACGKSVDSSCVPECQVKMYWCLDHDPPYESDKRDSCMNDAEGEFKKFGADWDAVHPYMFLRRTTMTGNMTV